MNSEPPSLLAFRWLVHPRLILTCELTTFAHTIPRLAACVSSVHLPLTSLLLLELVQPCPCFWQYASPPTPPYTLSEDIPLITRIGCCQASFNPRPLMVTSPCLPDHVFFLPVTACAASTRSQTQVGQRASLLCKVRYHPVPPQLMIVNVLELCSCLQILVTYVSPYVLSVAAAIAYNSFSQAVIGQRPTCQCWLGSFELAMLCCTAPV